MRRGFKYLFCCCPPSRRPPPFDLATRERGVGTDYAQVVQPNGGVSPPPLLSRLGGSHQELGRLQGGPPHRGQGLVQACIPYMYPCGSRGEDPLTEARAWSRHVSHICIPVPSTRTYWRESPRTGPRSGRTPSQRPGPGPACIPYMYPRPLYSHIPEGVTKNWAAFREDPLTEARAWSRHVSHICISAPSTRTYWRESPRTGPPSERTSSQRPGPGPGMYPIYVSPPPLLARTGGSHQELGPLQGGPPHIGQDLVQACIPYMYPRLLYSHVLEGVTKNWAPFREDPLT
jgi:hypothetical protein